MAEFTLKQTAEEVQNAVDNALSFGDTEVVVLEEQELVYDAENSGCIGVTSVPIENGDELTVVFDGNSYVCTAIFYAAVGFVLFGNMAMMDDTIDTGEPFVGMYAQGLVLISAMDEANHNVKITAPKATPIPEKYLPRTVLYCQFNDEYLYTDVACTTKATLYDVPDNIDFEICIREDY